MAMPVAMDMASAKTLKLDQLQQKGKEVTVGMQDYAMNQKSLHQVIEQHDGRIQQLFSNFRAMEAQVKSIARIMVSQNISTLHEDQQEQFATIKKQLSAELADSLEDVHRKIDKSLGEVLGRRDELRRKVDSMEQKLSETIIERDDAQTVARHALASSFDKLSQQFQINETDQVHQFNTVKDLIAEREKDTKVMGKRLRDELEAEATNRARGLLEITQGSERAMDDTRTLMNTSLKEIKSLVDKVDSKLGDMVACVRADLTKEAQDRQDSAKEVMNKTRDLVDATQRRVEKLVETSGQEARAMVDRSMALMDTRPMIQQEALTRDNSFKELQMLIDKERSTRNLDEDRLMALITHCMQGLETIQTGAFEYQPSHGV